MNDFLEFKKSLSLVILILAIAGCSHPIEKKGKPDLADFLGRKEGKGVEPEKITRDEVLRKIGEPTWSALNGTLFCYEAKFKEGDEFQADTFAGMVLLIPPIALLIMGPGGDGSPWPGDTSLLVPVYNTSSLLMWFDESNILRHYDFIVVREDGNEYRRFEYLYEFCKSRNLGNNWFTKENVCNFFQDECAWTSPDENVSFYGSIDRNRRDVRGVYVRYDHEDNILDYKVVHFGKVINSDQFDQEIDSIMASYMPQINGG